MIPLELLPAGEFDIIYRAPLDPRSGELPVLPLSINGAVAMAHAADNQATSDGYVAADTFFVMKFDKQQVRRSGVCTRLLSVWRHRWRDVCNDEVMTKVLTSSGIGWLVEALIKHQAQIVQVKLQGVLEEQKLPAYGGVAF